MDLCDSLSSIRIVEYNKYDTDVNCVLGCLCNDRGLSICKELVKWIQLRWHLWIVFQDYPGKLYEYPALKYAQKLANQFNKPVMYLHTKGAFNDSPIQLSIRALWWHTFFVRYNECISALKKYDIVCPFTGQSKMTWYNGFIANPFAWGNVIIKPEADRYIFESLWRTREILNTTTIYGMYGNNLNDSHAVSSALINNVSFFTSGKNSE